MPIRHLDPDQPERKPLPNIRCLTPEQLENGARLLRMIEMMTELESKSNAELADLLIEHVWAELPITSPASALLSEIASRLKGEDSDVD